MKGFSFQLQDSKDLEFSRDHFYKFMLVRHPMERLGKESNSFKISPLDGTCLKVSWSFIFSNPCLWAPFKDPQQG